MEADHIRKNKSWAILLAREGEREKRGIDSLDRRLDVARQQALLEPSVRDDLIVVSVPRKAKRMEWRYQKTDQGARLGAHLDCAMSRQHRRARIERFFPSVHVIVGSGPAWRYDYSEQAPSPKFIRELSARIPSTFGSCTGVRGFNLYELCITDRRSISPNYLNPMSNSAPTSDPIPLNCSQQRGAKDLRRPCRGIAPPGQKTLFVLHSSLRRGRAAYELVKGCTVSDRDCTFDESTDRLARRARKLLDRLSELERKRLALYSGHALLAYCGNLNDGVEFLGAL